MVPFIITLGSLRSFAGWPVAGVEHDGLHPGEAKPWWFGRILAIEPRAALAARRAGRLGPRWCSSVLLAAGLAVQPAGPVRLRDRLERGDRAALRDQRAAGQDRRSTPWRAWRPGLAGVLQFVYLDATGDPTTADGLELQVIAAVVIGGGSLSGGEGTVLGTLIGCLIMSVLNNGCVHAGIPNASQDIIIGVIIVAAVCLIGSGDGWRSERPEPGSDEQSHPDHADPAVNASPIRRPGGSYRSLTSCRPGSGKGMTRRARLPFNTDAGWPLTSAVQPGIQVSATTSKPGASVVTRITTRSGSSESHSAGVKGWRRVSVRPERVDRHQDDSAG